MRYTKSQMEESIALWRSSGLSKKEFCRQHNITNSTFHYWHKRLRKTAGFGFTEVIIDRQQPATHELVFPSGTRMIVHGEPSVAWLRELVN